MSEILTAAQAAREIGCSAQKVRERMKRNLWDLGEVIPAKKLDNISKNEYNIYRYKLDQFLGGKVKNC